MKGSSVCLIFFLVLIFTTSGNCRVTTAEDTKKPDANRSCIITPWKCEASGCDRDCKVEWGSQATGYCDKDQSLTGTCMCKVGSDCH